MTPRCIDNTNMTKELTGITINIQNDRPATLMANNKYNSSWSAFEIHWSFRVMYIADHIQITMRKVRKKCRRNPWIVRRIKCEMLKQKTLKKRTNKCVWVFIFYECSNINFLRHFFQVNTSHITCWSSCILYHWREHVHILDPQVLILFKTTCHRPKRVICFNFSHFIRRIIHGFGLHFLPCFLCGDSTKSPNVGKNRSWDSG